MKLVIRKNNFGAKFCTKFIFKKSGKMIPDGRPYGDDTRVFITQDFLTIVN